MPKSNNADAFKIHFNMMQMSGVWPEKNPNLFYNIRAAITWILGTALAVTMLMEFFNDITDITKLSEILYVMVSVTFYLIKLSLFNSKKKTFLKMIDFLKEPVFTFYPDDLDHYMARTIRTSSLMANCYRYLCLCCMVLFAVYPVLDEKPLPFLFPYDVGTVAWNNSCLDSLAACLMGVGAAQLDILMGKLLRIGEENSAIEESVKEKRVIKNLRQCVDHHLAIIQFIEYIETVFTAGILVQFMASILVICNTLFHFVLISRSSSQFFMLLNYFAIMAMELYIYCWYGNEVMWKELILFQSVFVGQACYFSKWYDYSTEVGQYLFIIMERSKRPLSISALKFSKLSLTAFTSIIQWSYSYLALLLKMYQEKTPTQKTDGYI